MPRMASTANFSSSYGGLTTIGYAVYNLDGSVKAARTTSDVVELGFSSGIYRTVINYEPQFRGFVLWDTGSTPPIYASESINPIDADPISDEIRTMFRSLNRSLSAYLERQFSKDDVKPVLDKIEEDRLKDVRSKLDDLSKKIEGINVSPQINIPAVDMSGIENTIKTVGNDVKAAVVKHAFVNTPDPKLDIIIGGVNAVRDGLGELSQKVESIEVSPQVTVENKDILASVEELKKDKSELEAISNLSDSLRSESTRIERTLTSKIASESAKNLNEHSKRMDEMKRKLADDFRQANRSLSELIHSASNEILSQDHKKELMVMHNTMKQQHMNLLAGIMR